MLTLIKILVVTAAVLALAGFIIVTFGLFKSFILDKFSKFIYLGLAAICTGALVFGMSVGVGYLQVRSIVNDINSSSDIEQDSGSDPIAEDGVDTLDESSTTEGDSDVDDPSDLEYTGTFPEDFIPAAYENSGDTYECIPSEEASNFIAPFYLEPQSVLPGETYIVASSETTGYIVSNTPSGPSIVYVDTYTYQISAANDTALDISSLYFPEYDGFDPIDTSSEEYVVAEGCVS